MNADLDYRLPALQKRPVKNVIGVLITVFSAAISSLYGFASWILKQLDPLTASPEWLALWADRLNVPRKEATAARGKVTFAGSGTIDAGTRLSLNDLVYITAETGQADTEIAIVSETKGSHTNQPIDTLLTLETPISGINMEAKVTSVLTGGANIENLNDWAIRIAKRMADRQKIGDKDDYEDWALQSHPDIIDAWVQANTPQLGSVTIRVIVGGDSPFPSNEVLISAQLQIDKIRNQGATVWMLAAKAQATDIRIAGVDNEEHQAVITQQITSLIAKKRQRYAELYPEEIERIIAQQDNSYTLLLPLSKTMAADDSLLTLGSIEWV